MALRGVSRDPRRAHLAACDGLYDGFDDGPVPFAQFSYNFVRILARLGRRHVDFVLVKMVLREHAQAKAL